MREYDSISIIIPTYNEASNLRRLIPFLSDLGKKFITEIIVVDGGSTDNSPIIANQLGAVVINSSKACRATQLNAGAKFATSKILYFLHADSLPLKSLAEDIWDAKQAGYSAGCYRYEFDSEHPMLKINSWFTRFNGFLSGGGDQSLFIFKSLFNDLGGYDENYIIMEDFEFVRRIKKVSKFKVIQKSILVSARKYESNGWLSVQWANFLAVLAFKLGGHPERIKSLYFSRLKRNLNP